MMDGNSVQLNGSGGDTIQSIKEKIQATIGVPPYDQHLYLIYGDDKKKDLHLSNDSKKLCHYRQAQRKTTIELRVPLLSAVCIHHIYTIYVCFCFKFYCDKKISNISNLWCKYICVIEKYNHLMKIF